MFRYRDDACCGCPDCRPRTHSMPERFEPYPPMPDASHRRNDPGIREQIAYLRQTGTPDHLIRVVEEGTDHECSIARVVVDPPPEPSGYQYTGGWEDGYY